MVIYHRDERSVEFVYATGSLRDGIVTSYHRRIVNHDLTDFHAALLKVPVVPQAGGAGAHLQIPFAS
jgi:hypothetical protein